MSKAKPGTPETKVLECLGRPNLVFEKGETIAFQSLYGGMFDLPNIHVSHKAYVYRVLVTYLFVVTFDEHDRVECAFFDDT